MRKTIFAFVSALILLTTFSCGKDNDKPSASIVGTWTLESQTTKYYVNGTTDPADDDVYDPATDGVATFIFNANSTLITVSDGESDTTSYIYDSGNKKLTFTESGIGFVFDITTQTSSSLKLHNEYSYTDPSTGTNNKSVTDISLKK